MSDFWSRRRQAVEAEAKAEEVAVQAEQAAATEAELAARTDEELLAELDLPEPEELDSAEAVRDFMNSALPQRLKTRALRQLWKLNPVLANLDGLVDYGEDFTDSATVIENLQTAYQVGKGMLRHVEALAAEAEEKAAQSKAGQPEDDEGALDEEAPGQVDEDTERLAEAEALPEAPAPQTSYAITPEAPEAPVQMAPRRMQFRFEEHV